MGIGIKDVASRAGVSVGTVSNVLNRPDAVAEPTRARVLAAIDELGFVRNESARHLRAGQSRAVGMIVLDVGNPFFTDMARGAEDAADDDDLAVILCNSAHSTERELRHLQRLEQQRVLGVLLTRTRVEQDHVRAMRRRGTPVVLLDESTGSIDSCSVGVDDPLGGQIATRHLLGRGHRRLAFVGGPRTLQQVADRLAGAERAVAEAGERTISLSRIETSGLNVASGAAAGAEICALPSRRRPTAVFCANDLLALGLLQEFTRRGVRVPRDVAIVGYDDIDFAAAAAIPLSSVKQPREQLGRAAMELLMSEVRDTDGHRHRHVVFTPELVVRASTDFQRGPSRSASASAEKAAV